MAFLQLLVLHLSDANMEIHKYRLVVLSHFWAVVLVQASFAGVGFADL